MRRIAQVAWREYASTVLTKGFIIGAFVVPGLIAAAMPLIIILMSNTVAPQVVGRIAIIDRSEMVAIEFEKRLDQERSLANQVAVDAEHTADSTGALLDKLKQDQLARVAENTAILSLDTLAPDAALDDAKELLRNEEEDSDNNVLAVLEIDPDAILKPDDQSQFGGYAIFVRPGLDDRNIGYIRDTISGAIKTARYVENDVVASEIEAMVTVRGKSTQEVTATGERGGTEILRMMLPFAFMMLIMLAVMIGGQYLLTTTVEEKSSRVVEILLSALSPMQLMSGKIFGQMAVGLTLMIIYGGLSGAALLVFGVGDILTLQSIVLLFVYFILAYFMIASLLAAVGSAVNDLREAQALQTPVMMFTMLPYLFWMPISRNPNGTLALVLSFIPPINPFVMIMRVTSTDPPPMWQILVSLLTAGLGAWFCLWLAAKVFRVGLLMFGKPPNIATLIKWIRMA